MNNLQPNKSRPIFLVFYLQHPGHCWITLLHFQRKVKLFLSSIVYFNNDTLRLKSAINENILEQLDALQIQQLNSVLNLPVDSLTVNTDIYITLTK